MFCAWLKRRRSHSACEKTSKSSWSKTCRWVSSSWVMFLGNGGLGTGVVAGSGSRSGDGPALPGAAWARLGRPETAMSARAPKAAALPRLTSERRSIMADPLIGAGRPARDGFLPVGHPQAGHRARKGALEFTVQYLFVSATQK